MIRRRCTGTIAALGTSWPAAMVMVAAMLLAALLLAGSGRWLPEPLTGISDVAAEPVLDEKELRSNSWSGKVTFGGKASVPTAA